MLQFTYEPKLDIYYFPSVTINVSSVHHVFGSIWHQLGETEERFVSMIRTTSNYGNRLHLEKNAFHAYWVLSLAYFQSADMKGTGFMTFSPARHQGEIELFWLHCWSRPSPYHPHHVWAMIHDHLVANYFLCSHRLQENPKIGYPWVLDH